MSKINVRRLTKNTLLLYFRMLLLMGVSLYTVRVVLATLGVVDYGLFNVVGGVVTLLAFISNSMATSSQRFFSFEIGKSDEEGFAKAFRASRTLYGIMALIILVIAETAGLWFLQTRMVVPAEREIAAFWVYQFSILSFLVTITNTPYTAAIISHENMGIYAWISLLEAMLKLFAVYMLKILPFDKLITYSGLVFGAISIKSLAFKLYCIIKYKKASWRYSLDRDQLRLMLSFVGWNVFGSLASVARAQGVNVVLNLFFGPVINAARGVAFQVNAAITHFATYFTTALRPQIVKSYAAGQKKEMVKLVFMSSRFTYLLMLVLSMPVLLETDFLLSLWLGQPSPYMVVFTRIIIVQGVIQSLSLSLTAAAQATGEIKWFQILVGGFQLLNLPIVWLSFRFLGTGPEYAFVIGLLIECVSIWLRLFVLNKTANLSIREYCIQVLVVVTVVSLISIIPPFAIQRAMPYGLLRFLTVSSASVTVCLAVSWYVGISATERRKIVELIRKIQLRKVVE